MASIVTRGIADVHLSEQLEDTFRKLTKNTEEELNQQLQNKGVASSGTKGNMVNSMFKSILTEKTVKELKSELKARSMSQSGRKNELIERLLEKITSTVPLQTKATMDAPTPSRAPKTKVTAVDQQMKEESADDIPVKGTTSRIIYDLFEMTAKDLKARLKEKNEKRSKGDKLKLSGTKNDLVKRLINPTEIDEKELNSELTALNLDTSCGKLVLLYRLIDFFYQKKNGEEAPDRSNMSRKATASELELNKKQKEEVLKIVESKGNNLRSDLKRRVARSLEIRYQHVLAA